jgi:hypothetical protein
MLGQDIIFDSVFISPWLICHVNLWFKQIAGGDPLLKLIAVDWFKVNERFDSVALHPKSLVQVKLLNAHYQQPFQTNTTFGTGNLVQTAL